MLFFNSLKHLPIPLTTCERTQWFGRQCSAWWYAWGGATRHGVQGLQLAWEKVPSSLLPPMRKWTLSRLNFVRIAAPHSLIVRDGSPGP